MSEFFLDLLSGGLDLLPLGHVAFVLFNVDYGLKVSKIGTRVVGNVLTVLSNDRVHIEHCYRDVSYR